MGLVPAAPSHPRRGLASPSQEHRSAADLSYLRQLCHEFPFIKSIKFHIRSTRGLSALAASLRKLSQGTTHRLVGNLPASYLHHRGDMCREKPGLELVATLSFNTPFGDEIKRKSYLKAEIPVRCTVQGPDAEYLAMPL